MVAEISQSYPIVLVKDGDTIKDIVGGPRGIESMSIVPRASYVLKGGVIDVLQRYARMTIVQAHRVPHCQVISPYDLKPVVVIPAGRTLNNDMGLSYDIKASDII